MKSAHASHIRYIISTHSTKRRVAIGQLHEQNAVSCDKQNATPLRQLDHLVPIGSGVGQLRASSVAPLESELVFLRQHGEVWRPCALASVWVGLPGVGEEGRHIDGWRFGRGEWVHACPSCEGGQHGLVDELLCMGRVQYGPDRKDVEKVGFIGMFLFKNDLLLSQTWSVQASEVDQAVGGRL